MELADEIAAMGGEEKAALADALLRELGAGSRSEKKAESGRESELAAALKKAAETLAAVGKSAKSAEMPDAATREKAVGTTDADAAERQALAGELASVSIRRAHIWGGAGAAAEKAAGARAPYAVEAASVTDAEAISRAVRRAARCEDAPYERY